jgi:hypothetical protein
VEWGVRACALSAPAAVTAMHSAPAVAGRAVMRGLIGYLLGRPARVPAG